MDFVHACVRPVSIFRCDNISRLGVRESVSVNGLYGMWSFMKITLVDFWPCLETILLAGLLKTKTNFVRHVSF